MADAPPNPDRLLARVLRTAAREQPASIPRAINDVGREFGFRDIRVLLVDLHQLALRQLGRPEVSHTIDSEAGEAFRTQRSVSRREDDVTQMFVPLRGPAERLGVLSLVVGDVLSHDDLERLDDLAALVGELVLTRDLIGDEITLTRRSRELSLAAELRWMLLPPLTVSLPEVEVSGILEPAYDIAGDTFDYALGHQHLELAILDAVGHGLESSQLASFAVGAYRNLRRRRVDIVGMLREMDQWIVEQFGESRFVTCQLATLDVGTGRMEIVNAGHPAPLVLDAGGSPREVACRPCPPLGLGHADAVRYDLQLAPGDAVLFYSDGIVESRSPDGTFYGLDRAGRHFAELLGRGLSTAEVVRQMVSEVLAHETTALRDDATLVLVRWFGPSPS